MPQVKQNGSLEVKTYLLLHNKLTHSLQLFLRSLTFLGDDALYPLSHMTLKEWLDETAG